jgi:hypothetical protein
VKINSCFILKSFGHDCTYIFQLYFWLRLLIPCVTLCCCLCRTALLFLGLVAVVNENLFSTGLPDEIKVKLKINTKS